MSTTVNVICYKSKILKNGESPLMLRICKDGKKKYVGLGLSIQPTEWDFSKNLPKPEHTDSERLKVIISEIIAKYNKKILELTARGEEFTAASLADAVNTRKKAETVGELFLEHIQQLDEEGRRGYMLSLKQTYNSLLAFNKHLDIPFSTIDVTWLKRYENYLHKQELKDNTIGIRMRSLRVIYNLAIEQDITDKEKYPFKNYKVAKLNQKTLKRALRKHDVNKIIRYTAKNQYEQFAIDIFLFTYYAGGINFVDIANLTRSNIIDGKLAYYRTKTKALIAVPLQPQAVAILEKYAAKESPYLFPILSKFHKTKVQKANRVHKVITKVNKRLKEIGETLNLPLKITTYVARHSQATIMKQAGVSVSIISDIMGHSSEKVTQYYLDSFENSQFSDAMNKL